MFNYVHIITICFLALICYSLILALICYSLILEYMSVDVSILSLNVALLIVSSQHRPYVQSRVDPSISSWKNSNAGQLLVRRSSWCFFFFFRVRKVQQHGKLAQKLLMYTYVVNPIRNDDPKSPFLWSINHLQIFGVLYIGFPHKEKVNHIISRIQSYRTQLNRWGRL